MRRTVPPSAEIEAQIDQLLAVGVGENPRETLSELAKLGARRSTSPGARGRRHRPRYCFSTASGRSLRPGAIVRDSAVRVIEMRGWESRPSSDRAPVCRDRLLSPTSAERVMAFA